MKEEQIKKYVLFSPVGTHDPVGVPDEDGKASEGSMLHIIRHYKPEIVYLYITKELDYKDNRYKKAIKKFHPSCEVIEKFSELDEDDANNYDAFIDFKKYIKEIYDKYNKKGYEILLNIASGTPQMKSNLILEVVTSNIKLIPVQVDTPTKKKNFKDKFEFSALDNIDTVKEEKRNRCKEPGILSFKRAKIQSQIESLIENYEYSASYNLFKDIDDISDLFNNKLLKYLLHAYLRVNLKYEEAKKVITFSSDNNINLTNDENKLLEYYYVMKIKQKKGELSDFILRITPFVTDLLFYYLKKQVPALNKVLIDSKKDGKQICIYSSHDKDFIKNMEGYKGNHYKINLSRLLSIMLYYNNNIDNKIKKLFEDMRNIEKEIRNNVAHRMINITEEYIEEKVGLPSEEIMKKNEELLKRIIPKINIDYFLYDEINQKIKDLLQEHK